MSSSGQQTYREKMECIQRKQQRFLLNNDKHFKTGISFLASLQQRHQSDVTAPHISTKIGSAVLQHQCVCVRACVGACVRFRLFVLFVFHVSWTDSLLKNQYYFCVKISMQTVEFEQLKSGYISPPWPNVKTLFFSTMWSYPLCRKNWKALSAFFP